MLIMNEYFKSEKNLVITYVIHLSLQLHLFTVSIMVENQSLSWSLKCGSLFHPPLSRLNLSQDLKKQLRNGSLVIAPADFAKRITSWFPIEFNFEKDKSFQTA